MTPDIPHNIRIRLAQLKFLFCFLRHPTGQRLSNVRVQQKKIQLGQSYSYVMRNVWYHQIWIQNNLGFMMSVLNCTYLPNVTKSKVNKHNCYQFISVSHIWWYFHIHSLSEIFRLIQWQKNCCSNGGDSPTHHNT